MEQPASVRHDDEGPMNDSDALLPGHIQRANIWRLAIAQALAGANAVAVYAAEQLYGAGAGKEKLIYVKGQLAKKGYKVDVDEIEAAVRELTVISAP